MHTFREYLIEASEYEALKKNKKPLTDEEREECMKGKAIWHHAPKGKASPAVWKSINKNGKTTYITNTHRAYAAETSLKKAIAKYHSFIKGTS